MDEIETIKKWIKMAEEDVLRLYMELHKAEDRRRYQPMLHEELEAKILCEAKK